MAAARGASRTCSSPGQRDGGPIIKPGMTYWWSASLIASPTAPTAATPAAHRPANHASRLMIAMFADLAAEYPIGPARIGKDDRDQDRGADQHEDLALIGRSRLPDGEPAGDD